MAVLNLSMRTQGKAPKDSETIVPRPCRTQYSLSEMLHEHDFRKALTQMNYRHKHTAALRYSIRNNLVKQFSVETKVNQC